MGSPRRRTSSTSPSAMPSKWATAGWWFVLSLSVPFAVYASLFVYGKLHVYRQFTLTAFHGNYEKAGLNIQQHLPAWQVHSLAAIVFVFTGPFQFAPNFRNRNPKIHRYMGYAFFASSIVLPVTGTFFMNPYSEFGKVGRTVFAFEGVILIAWTGVAYLTARQKKFKVHQRYMIRAAALGYSTVGMRPLIIIFAKAGVDFWTSTDLGAIFAPLLYVVVAEIYIQKILSPKQRQTRPVKGVQENSEKPHKL